MWVGQNSAAFRPGNAPGKLGVVIRGEGRPEGGVRGVRHSVHRVGLRSYRILSDIGNHYRMLGTNKPCNLCVSLGIQLVCPYCRSKSEI